MGSDSDPFGGPPKPSDDDGMKIQQSQRDVLKYYNFQNERFKSIAQRSRVNERLHSNIDMAFAIIIGIISAIVIPGVDVYMKGAKFAHTDIPISIFFSWIITLITVISSKAEFAKRSKDYLHVVSECDKVIQGSSRYCSP